MRASLNGLALLLALALGVASARADELELVGPPLLSPNGCSYAHEWDDEHVAAALNAPVKVVKKARTRWGMHTRDLCTLPRKTVGTFLEYARQSKFGMDEPHKALAWRKLSLVGIRGEIRPEDLLAALAQRDAAVQRGKSRAKAAGVTSSAWTNLGPARVGVSGRIRAIAPHPTIPGRILVGSVAGGIWKTTDQGGNWTPVNDLLPSVAVTCLVHDPSNASVMYACTGEGAFNGDAIRGLGIFRSTDAGDTWAQLPATTPSDSASQWYYVNRIAVHPANPLVVIAAANNGIQRSTDGGVSWGAPAGVPPNAVFDVKFNRDGSRVVAAERTGGGVFWSANGGATWTRSGIAPFGRVELALSESTGSWYALANWEPSPTTGSAGALFKSVDGAQTWSFVSAPRNLGVQGWYDMALWVAPDDDNKIIVGGDGHGIAMSIDGGLSFASIGNGVHADHHVLVSAPAYLNGAPHVYNGNDGGIYILFDVRGVSAARPPGFNQPTSRELNGNLSITQFYGAAGSNVPTRRLIGGTQDNGTWAYDFATARWTQTAGGDGAFSAADPTDSNYLYGQFQWGAVHRVTDGGANPFSAQSICLGLADGACGGGHATNFISPLTLDPNNPNRLYAGAARLWRTDNAKDPNSNNVRWSVVKPAPVNGYNLSAIAVAPGNSDIVWVGDSAGNLYRTLNGNSASPTWSGNLSPSAGWPITRIVVDRNNPSRVYLTFGGFRAGNVMMTNQGLLAQPQWIDRSVGLPNAPVRGFAVHPASNLWWYAGTEIGVFTSEDGGNTWTTTNDGPGTVSVDELFFLDPSTLVAATHGRGIFTATVQQPPAGSVFQFDTLRTYGREGTSVPVRVLRNGNASGRAEVRVSTTGGNATAGSDYEAFSNVPLVWEDGDATPRTVNMRVLEDTQADSQETVVLALSAPVNGALGTPNTMTVITFDPEAFPPDCMVPAGWVRPAGSDVGWSVDFDNAYEGICSLRSDTVTFGALARIEFTGEFRAGNITFRRRIAAPDGWAFFRFYIDGRLQGPDCAVGQVGICSGANVTSATASGNTDWTQPAATLSFPISAGTHTIQFSYERNSAPREAGAWIDAVSLPLAGPVAAAKARPDFNADGKADVLSTYPDGRVELWTMDGVATTARPVVLGPNSGFTPMQLGDFNGDGKSDIAWQHADGRVVVWLMNGTAFSGGGTILGPGTGWSVAHAGDFNGDGKTDILWRNTSGAYAIWLMDGAAVAGGGTILAGSSGWTATRIADFDGDGRADILWTHADGRVAVWLMNGAAVAGGGGILGAGTGWAAIQAGDFNGDGKADIVWQHADGRIALWLMNGAAVAGGGGIFGGGTAWTVARVADFNGDGRADLLWLHPDGRASIWLMDGAASIEQRQVLPAGGWFPKRTGDLNGDGKADIVWQHANGSVAVWTMNGTVSSGDGDLLGSGTGLQVSTIGQ